MVSTLAVTHFAHEDPDQPEASRDEGQQDVSDEVPESVATTGASGHKVFLSLGFYYKPCFSREKRNHGVSVIPLITFREG